MNAPYRDADFPRCLGCQQPIRTEGESLHCDACGASLVSLAALTATLRADTKLPAVVTFTHERPDAAHCPRCTGAMLRCRIDVQLEGTHAHTWRSLLRCPTDGVWFSREGLAKFNALVERKAAKEYKRELGPRAHGLFTIR
ncbi:MAG TPA: hypothetical protein VGM90_33245 [Kofleriaceae bacterium]